MVNTIATLLIEKENAIFPELAEHSIRCSRLIRKLAEYTSYEGSIQELKIGALIHDIGKLGIPFEILSCDREYTEEERAIMQTHVSVGYTMARELECFTNTELAMIRYHHERLDGSGYLNKLTEIPEAVQMLSVVDTYDAIINERCYKPAMSKFEAFKILDKCAADGKISKYYVDALKQIV